MKAVRFAIVVCLVLLLSSCGSKAEKNIVGKWKEVGGTETMEFSKDGTVKVIEEGLEMGGTYTVLDDNRVRVELELGPIVECKVSGEKLTVKMPDMDPGEYERVK